MIYFLHVILLATLLLTLNGILFYFQANYEFQAEHTSVKQYSTKPFKGHCGGKNLGCIWEDFFFSNVLRSLEKLLRSLEKLLRSLKKLCVLSQNQLSSDILYMFTLQLAVVTARMFIMEQFIEFYLEIGLNKVIEQSVLSSRHSLKD